jgi:hypothetical protein
VKAAAVRRLADAHGVDALEQAAEALIEREEDLLGVDGDDPGEKLTHVMLAIRVKRRIIDGEDPKEAFRNEMASVRTVLSNE